MATVLYGADTVHLPYYRNFFGKGWSDIGNIKKSIGKRWKEILDINGDLGKLDHMMLKQSTGPLPVLLRG